MILDRSLTQPQGSNPRPRDLRVLGRFHTADADGAQAVPVLEHRHAAFEHAADERRAQERGAPAIDDILVNLALAPAQRRRMRLRRRNVRGYRRRAVKPLQPQQMAAVVDDGNRDRPVILQRLGFGRCRHLLDIG